MYFILCLLLMLWVILVLITYKVMVEVLFPIFLGSQHFRTFNERISRSLSALFKDITKDTYAHLTTLCEPDGDEEFEPFLDSPLRTCPPCEYIFSPPKEEINPTDQNNNGTGTTTADTRRRQPRRGQNFARPADAPPLLNNVAQNDLPQPPPNANPPRQLLARGPDRLRPRVRPAIILPGILPPRRA